MSKCFALFALLFATTALAEIRFNVNVSVTPESIGVTADGSQVVNLESALRHSLGITDDRLKSCLQNVHDYPKYPSIGHIIFTRKESIELLGDDIFEKNARPPSTVNVTLIGGENLTSKLDQLKKETFMCDNLRNQLPNEICAWRFTEPYLNYVSSKPTEQVELDSSDKVAFTFFANGQERWTGLYKSLSRHEEMYTNEYKEDRPYEVETPAYSVKIVNLVKNITDINFDLTYEYSMDGNFAIVFPNRYHGSPYQILSSDYIAECVPKKSRTESVHVHVEDSMDLTSPIFYRL